MGLLFCHNSKIDFYQFKRNSFWNTYVDWDTVR